MSWDAATSERETHRVAVGGIKQGFSGFVPRAKSHYGSSHVGGLPYRDIGKWKEKAPQDYAVKRNFPQKGVNHRSSSEIGRSAWNVEWSDQRRLLTLLRPAELEKYNMSKQRDYGSGKNSRDLEGGVNLLEQLTGLDLDRDGDVGAKGNTAQPKAASRPRSAAAAPASARAYDRELDLLRGRTTARPGYSANALAAANAAGSSTSTPMPSYRKSNFSPISRDHHSAKAELYKNHIGGIMPYYMGHVPKNHTQYGIATVGGLHPDASGLYDA